MPPQRRSGRSKGEPAPRIPSQSPERIARKANKKSSRSPGGVAATGAMSGKQVAKAESKLSKILTRVFFGAVLIAIFLGILYAGHMATALFVVILQACIFRELVGIRYKENLERNLPMFRTVQWLWFAAAMFYTYGEMMHDITMNLMPKSPFLWVFRYHTWVSFGVYAFLFMVSVLTLKKDTVKYQLGQYTWTLVTCCLIVFQMKFVAHNIFAGLFWFVLPCFLVVINDIMAYFSGMMFGRRIIKATFLEISPNKTWEGYIGGGLWTLVFAWYFSAYISQFPFLTCPAENLDVWHTDLTCEPAWVFERQEIRVAQIILDNNPLNNYVELPTTFEALPCQVHALGLAIFACIVAPFGGFLASGIKRAYGIKDFDSLIPGHGGFMDRMDCQLIMSLCTYVHYKTFVRASLLSIPAILHTIGSLDIEEQKKIYEVLGHNLKGA